MPTTPDPYATVAQLLAAARDDSARRADHDRAFPSVWANAEMALQLATIGLPDAELVDDETVAARVDDQGCLGLVVQAIRTLDHIEPGHRRPEHLLDLAYAVAAADEVRRALGGEPGPA